MSVAAFLSELRRRDIRVWVDGEQLRCNARVGTLTPELRDELRQRRGDLLEFLRAAEAVAKQQSAIVPLQRNGESIPVFAVPGHDGDVFCYRALAQALGEEQPFFGLQPPGVDGQSEPLTRVEELAAYFAAQVRAFQPRGPYIIAGFCAGGTVALELAQLLATAGEQIAFLALFGSPFPTFFRRWTQSRRWVAHQMQRISKHARVLVGRPWRDGLEYLRRKMQEREEPPDPVLVLRAKVGHATVIAVRVYRPQPFAGRICLFLPSRQWARAGFAALRWNGVGQRTDEYFGPDGCTHLSMLLPQNAPAFAAFFRRACGKSINPSKVPSS